MMEFFMFLIFPPSFTHFGDAASHPNKLVSHLHQKLGALGSVRRGPRSFSVL